MKIFFLAVFTIFGVTASAQELSRKDSIDLFFQLRDSIELMYDEARSVDSHKFNMLMAKEYRDSWLFLNYRLKAWKLNRPFSFEWFEIQKALTLKEYGSFGISIEIIKVRDWR